MKTSMPAMILANLLGVGIYVSLRESGLSLATILAGMIGGATAMLIGGPIGLIFGHFISRDTDVETRGYKIVAWANLASFILPVAGVCLALITKMLSRQAIESKRFYSVMTSIGMIGATLSAAVGGGVEYSRRTQVSDTSIASQNIAALATGPHVRARCAYAAREAWSAEEFAAICRH